MRVNRRSVVGFVVIDRTGQKEDTRAPRCVCYEQKAVPTDLVEILHEALDAADHALAYAQACRRAAVAYRVWVGMTVRVRIGMGLRLR